MTLVLPSLLMRRLRPDSLRMSTLLPEANLGAFNQLFSVSAGWQRFMTPFRWPPRTPPQPLDPGESAGDSHPLPTRLQPVQQSDGVESVAGLGKWPARHEGQWTFAHQSP